MTRSNKNQEIDHGIIAEEDKFPDWENEAIDMKKDTDGASQIELLDMIAREIIPNSRDKYFESNITSEISTIKLYDKSDLSVNIKPEDSILDRRPREHLTIDEKRMIYQLI